MHRNEIRWAPFESLFQSSEVKKELETKQKICSKPILSEDELSTIQELLLRANHTKEQIKIEYYYNGFIYFKTGIISNILKNNMKIFFQDHTSLYFEQILSIQII